MVNLSPKIKRINSNVETTKLKNKSNNQINLLDKELSECNSDCDCDCPPDDDCECFINRQNNKNNFHCSHIAYCNGSCNCPHDINCYLKNNDKNEKQYNVNKCDNLVFANNDSIEIMRKAFICHLNKKEFDECLELSKIMRGVNFGKNHTINIGAFDFVFNKVTNSLTLNENVQTNPLIYSAYKGDLQLVQFLVESCGADINYVSDNNTTAIMYAYQRGHVDTVIYLLKKGADTEVTHLYGETTKMTNFSDKIHFKKYIELMDFLLHW